MSDCGAYEGEMARFLRLSEQEIEDLLAGNAPEEDLEDVAAFLVDVKAFASRDIDEALAQRHIATLSEEARSLAGMGRSVAASDVIAPGARGLRAAMNRTLSVMARAAAAVMATSMSMIGLAYAGVDLPGHAAEDAFRAVTGLELPNQEPPREDKSVSDDVKSVIESDSEPGCEFGQEVATAATKNADDEAGPDDDPCAEADDTDEGEPKGSKATGDTNSAEGRTEAEERTGGASGAGASNADDGKSTAEERSRGAANSGSADDGKSTADDRSSGASGSGSDDAGDTDDGKSTGDERSGGASGSSEDRPDLPVDLGR